VTASPQFDLFAPPPAGSRQRETPAPGGGAITLRPYQADALAGGTVEGEQYIGIRAALDAHDSALALLATGTGKTVIFSEYARELGGAVVVAHRDSLLRQAASKLKWATGEKYIGVEKAERRAYSSNYAVASVQTLRGDRLASFAARFAHVPLLVFDEGHRGVAPSYRKVREAFPNARALYITATGDRADRVGMHNVAETVAYRYEMRPATDDGWLAPLEWRPVPCSVDIGKIRIVGGDLDQDQLDEAMLAATAEIARATLESFGDGCGLIFTPGVKTAHAAAMALNRLRPGRFAAVDADTTDDERVRIEDQLLGGDLQGICNCGIYTEGYDYPNLLNVMDTVPTKSRLRCSQKVGRVTRPWEMDRAGRKVAVVDGPLTAALRRAAIAASPKPTGRYFALRGINSRHRLIGPADLLAGKAVPEDVIEEANRLADEKGGLVDEVLAEATARVDEKKQHELAAQTRAEQARLDALARKAAEQQVRVSIGDARSAWELFGTPPTVTDPDPAYVRPEDLASLKQRGRMQAEGIPIPPNCTKRMAQALIGKNIARAARGWTTMKQIRWAASFGMDARKWRAVQFLRVKDAIGKNRGRAIPPGQVDALLSGKEVR